MYLLIVLIAVGALASLGILTGVVMGILRMEANEISFALLVLLYISSPLMLIMLCVISAVMWSYALGHAAGSYVAHLFDV